MLYYEEIRMVRLLVFDLDSTLALLGQGIGKKELDIFQKLEKIIRKILVVYLMQKVCIHEHLWL